MESQSHRCTLQYFIPLSTLGLIMLNTFNDIDQNAREDARCLTPLNNYMQCNLFAKDAQHRSGIKLPSLHELHEIAIIRMTRGRLDESKEVWKYKKKRKWRRVGDVSKGNDVSAYMSWENWRMSAHLCAHAVQTLCFAIILPTCS